MTRYISTTETAKLIRSQLKAKFKGVKFSVRCEKYAGGSSIQIDWIDGPTQSMVDDIVKPFAGSGFDGMIDMKYSKDAFLLPDGSACIAQTSGTEGQLGTVSKMKVFKPCEEAERVRFGVDHVFTSRRTSRRLVESAILSFRKKFGDEAADMVHTSDTRDDGSCHAGVSDLDLHRQFFEILSRRIIASGCKF